MRTALLVALLATALPVLAQEVRPADLDRLARLDEALGHAARAALAQGSATDVALWTEAMAGPPGPLDPAGDWSCRTLKLGGRPGLVAYAPFRCRVTAAGPGAWRIEKLTGSQRLEGTIREEGGRALYLGVGFVAGGPATGYEGLPLDDQAAVDPGQTVAQVGVFEQPSPGRARLLLPYPLLESDFDVIALSR